MSEAAYLEFVNSRVQGAWELHDGHLVEKPGMTWRQLDIIAELIIHLSHQLDREEYRAFSESRARRPAATVFLPDVAVVPTANGDDVRDLPVLAIFSGPLPLVVEVWSPSTGDYDVDTNIPIYQQRGDLEFWRIHPYERTLTSWQRDPDGSYRETIHREGAVSPMALPGVTIDINTLFDA